MTLTQIVDLLVNPEYKIGLSFQGYNVSMAEITHETDPELDRFDVVFKPEGEFTVGIKILESLTIPNKKCKFEGGEEVGSIWENVINGVVVWRTNNKQDVIGVIAEMLNNGATLTKAIVLPEDVQIEVQK